jgi:DNA-binding CsgD family transcriptional regulator
MCSPAIRPMVDKWFDSDWTECNPRRERLIPRREPRFLTDLDAFTLEEIERDPFYQEFLRPLGFGWCTGTTIRTPAGDTLVFTSERLLHKGPVEQSAVDLLDQLRPHLSRAAVLAARFGLERAQASVEALQAMGLPAAVLTRDGRALAANRALTDGGTAIAIGAGDRLVLASEAAQALLGGGLQEAGGAAGATGGRSIPLAGDEDHPPAVAHLLPLRGQGRDIFSGASSLLFVTPLTPSMAPDVGVLEALFDLTPAEARVAGLLVEGRPVESIARQQGVTENTVRMQLKSVFAKTGAGQQSQLVSLLAMPSFPPRRP